MPRRETGEREAAPKSKVILLYTSTLEDALGVTRRVAYPICYTWWRTVVYSTDVDCNCHSGNTYGHVTKCSIHERMIWRTVLARYVYVLKMFIIASFSRKQSKHDDNLRSLVEIF